MIRLSIICSFVALMPHYALPTNEGHVLCTCLSSQLRRAYKK